jgi:predicted NBD/HSP70 family sugar kinase
MGRPVQRRILRPPELRGANRAAVLQLLRQNERLSRADVARRTGLSEGAISRIVASLVEDGLVSEDGAGSSTGGRPGRSLRLDPNRIAFGADIQNWETRCGVSTMRGRLIETQRFSTPKRLDAALDHIAEACLEYRNRFGDDRLEGIGITVRGIVNSETGVLEDPNNRGWAKSPVRRLMEARVPGPVFVENNVRAAAMAEYHFGPSELNGSRCFLFVKLDEGVGVGIVLDGRIYSGPHMAAGEFGRMVIAMSPDSQREDRPGCLERLISNAAIWDRYAAYAGAPQPAQSGDTSARVSRIAHQALDGDRASLAALEETGRYLGIGIANLVWGLDADVVVIEGALTQAWSIIEPAVRGQLPSRGMIDFQNLVIRPSSFGGDAALIGAATLPFTTVFSSGIRLAGQTSTPAADLQARVSG